MRGSTTASSRACSPPTCSSPTPIPAPARVRRRGRCPLRRVLADRSPVRVPDRSSRAAARRLADGGRHADDRHDHAAGDGQPPRLVDAGRRRTGDAGGRPGVGARRPLAAPHAGRPADGSTLGTVADVTIGQGRAHQLRHRHRWHGHEGGPGRSRPRAS